MPALGSALRVSRRSQALLVFGLTLALAGFSVLHNHQLGGMAGMTDEWVLLGANLNASGTLGKEQLPIVLRAPGYPAFIAVVLRVLTAPPLATRWDYLAGPYLYRCTPVLFLAHAVVLAAAAMLLFLWLSSLLRPSVALAAALSFGLNPYSILLTGLYHYDVLHMFLLIAGCMVLHQALERGTAWWLILAGLAWGIATLTRPLTLALPFYLGLGLLLKRGVGPVRALRHAALLALGIWLVLAPWALRNYRLTQRFIPVGAQGWAAGWGSSVKVLGVHPNYYNWWQLVPELKTVFSRVTGKAEYTWEDYTAHNLELEDAFKHETLVNLRRSPGTYLRNVACSLLAFNTQINSVFIKLFQHVQGPGAGIDSQWFQLGHAQDFHDGRASGAFSACMYLLTALAGGGAWIAIRGGHRWALAPGVVYACLCGGHAMTYMDLMYYYQRIPFLFIFGALLVDEGLARYGTHRIAGRVPVGALLLLPLVLPVLLTPFVIF
jgi:hypothetical protein